VRSRFHYSLAAPAGAGAAELRQAVQSGLLGKFLAIVSRENFSRFTHDFKKLYFYLKYLTP